MYFCRFLNNIIFSYVNRFFQCTVYYASSCRPLFSSIIQISNTITYLYTRKSVSMCVLRMHMYYVCICMYGFMCVHIVYIYVCTYIHIIYTIYIVHTPCTVSGAHFPICREVRANLSGIISVLFLLK